MVATKELEQLLERVPSWPEEMQEQVLSLLQYLEQEMQHPYELTEEDKASIERGLDDARHGRFVPDHEIQELLAKYRNP